MKAAIFKSLTKVALLFGGKKCGAAAYYYEVFFLIYTNLLLFLAAILVFSFDNVPEAPLLPPWLTLLSMLANLALFSWICRLMYRRPAALTSAGYFQVEKRLSFLSLVFFGVGALYLCDIKYYLAYLSFDDQLPALMNISGLAVFLLFLSVMWLAARRNYQYVFDRKYERVAFLLSNIKANLPIVLPWVALSICYDFLTLLPVPSIQKLLESEWGDMILFGLFLIFIVIFFPPLVRRLWGCRPLPEGELKNRLQNFCSTQRVTLDFYLWPLFEGRVLTAGIMGIVPGMRYLLLTPAIIQTMNREELESVIAHEIGHVKHRHLLLYVLLLACFSIFVGLFLEPLFVYLLSHSWVIDALIKMSVSPETVITVVSGSMILLFMVIYIRFIFGYFIRNFERQADLHVLGAVGSVRPLISAFEKIARLSGNIREQKNWHHFGIGERIDCLGQAEIDPDLPRRHNNKLRLSLLSYLLILCFGFSLVQQIPTEQFEQQYIEKYTEAILLDNIRKEPENASHQWQLAQLLMYKKKEAEALAAYEKAFSLEPTNPEIMNHLAWLLLTSEDLSLRSPWKALNLARGAATLKPRGYILDTLATAYWANSFLDKAIATEIRAAKVDRKNIKFYKKQAARFKQETYEESLQRQKLE